MIPYTKKADELTWLGSVFFGKFDFWICHNAWNENVFKLTYLIKVFRITKQCHTCVLVTLNNWLIHYF